MKTAGEIAELFAAPLDEFIERRDDLAKRLATRGEEDEARRIRTLRKPTVAAWTINRLSRAQPKEMRALADAVAAIRSARSADAMKSAVERRRDLVDALTTIAEKELGASPQVLSQVGQTLASASSEEALDALLAGTLTRPIEGSGFDEPLAVEPERKDTRLDAMRTRLEEAEAAVEERRGETDVSEQRVRQARRDLQAAEDDLRSRERALKKAERDRERIEKRLRG